MYYTCCFLYFTWGRTVMAEYMLLQSTGMGILSNGRVGLGMTDGFQGISQQLDIKWLNLKTTIGIPHIF